MKTVHGVGMNVTEILSWVPLVALLLGLFVAVPALGFVMVLILSGGEPYERLVEVLEVITAV